MVTGRDSGPGGGLTLQEHQGPSFGLLGQAPGEGREAEHFC